MACQRGTKEIVISIPYPVDSWLGSEDHFQSLGEGNGRRGHQDARTRRSYFIIDGELERRIVIIVF